MLTQQEILAMRNFLDRVGDADRAIKGRTEATNLIACFQALDREEALRPVPVPTET